MVLRVSTEEFEKLEIWRVPCEHLRTSVFLFWPFLHASSWLLALSTTSLGKAQQLLLPWVRSVRTIDLVSVLLWLIPFFVSFASIDLQFDRYWNQCHSWYRWWIEYRCQWWCHWFVVPINERNERCSSWWVIWIGIVFRLRLSHFERSPKRNVLIFPKSYFVRVILCSVFS